MKTCEYLFDRTRSWLLGDILFCFIFKILSLYFLSISTVIWNRKLKFCTFLDFHIDDNCLFRLLCFCFKTLIPKLGRFLRDLQFSVENRINIKEFTFLLKLKLKVDFEMRSYKRMKHCIPGHFKEEPSYMRRRYRSQLIVWTLLYQINILKWSYDVYNLRYSMRKLRFCFMNFEKIE